jgi:hypothetical protein
MLSGVFVMKNTVLGRSLFLAFLWSCSLETCQAHDISISSPNPISSVDLMAASYVDMSVINLASLENVDKIPPLGSAPRAKTDEEKAEAAKVSPKGPSTFEQIKNFGSSFVQEIGGDVGVYMKNLTTKFQEASKEALDELKAKNAAAIAQGEDPQSFKGQVKGFFQGIWASRYILVVIATDIAWPAIKVISGLGATK